MSFLNSLLDNDVNCISQLRMDRRTFDTLCQLLDDDGYVKSDGIVTLQEQVCIFLHIIAHHTKNRTIITRLFRLGETISRYFNSVLHGVLRLHKILLSPPKPISDNCLDDRWKVFKNCLGALDGTYIKVNVPEIDKPRYRTRKGCYYLVDVGYTNGEGFLAPYRGTRYHLSEWRDGCAPINHEEREMIIDPGEVEFDRSEDVAVNTDDDIIGSISSSDQWTNWRDDIAKQMFAERRCHGH
ncbi:uncharacterized protein LOC107411599 [Ziziphus jujuba]|uniref:Uncharacterized protein LOC107411599 n=1 Tax=Ziziphus jujuba TaxID=326968 RepID=A0ABM4A988_ZIZJJ|nr:uncharacterized protein LOC107411599 [Ziziphus jujuba]